MTTLEIPVTGLGIFGGNLRISNDHVALTVHEARPALAAMLRELVDARVPTTAHVDISRDGVVTLVGVEASAEVCA